ncbi:hypothetical protein ACIRS3_32110 [Streptomyces virginiae]|uniref:hypothetical protein n=1 Tax=Streptomyces virginiae TaxID=1961 RepID=UPI00381C25C4
MLADADELLRGPLVVLSPMLSELLSASDLRCLCLLMGAVVPGVCLAFCLSPPVGTQCHATALLQEFLDVRYCHRVPQGPWAERFEYFVSQERSYAERWRLASRDQHVLQRCDLGLYSFRAPSGLALAMLPVGGLLLALSTRHVPVPRPSATVSLALLDQLRLLLSALCLGPVPDHPA